MRSRGQVIRSIDLTTALGLLAGLFVVQQFGVEAVSRMRFFLERQLATLAREEFTEATITSLGASAGGVMMSALVPVFLVLPIVGAAATIVQTGPLLTGHGLKPDLDRVNPISAFRRLFSARSLVEMLKAMAKVSLVSFLVWRVYVESTGQILALGSSDVRSSTIVLMDIVMRLGITAGVALLTLAVLDYVYQRWEFQRSARMTKDELKEENKQSEGSPQTRARIRTLQRKLSRSRMMHEVPTADVVITNPTHLAVALSYRADEMAAPRLVAKGADFLAQRIREVAAEANVPIVENKPLAQTIYRTVDVNAEIPTALFQAVAEVLAYIYTLRGRNPIKEAQHGA
jgi:flagellar biosynthetic protein FlhB